MAYQFLPDVEQFVRSELKQNHYASKDDLFVDAIRLLQQEREAAIAGIQQGIESLERGEGIPLDEAFESLRRKHNLPVDAAWRN
jgi:Arc/MetJ-type ribon-helix-helix transcriptional regulator